MRRLILPPFLLLWASCVWAVLHPGSFVAQGPATEKKIALTFDDGPGPETSLVVDLLDRHGVKATFFMLGEQVKYKPSIARAVAERGHEVASHTMSHINYLQRYRALEEEMAEDPEATEKAVIQVRYELLEDMKASKRMIESKTGVKVKLCRMPHGIDRRWVKDAAAQAGLVMVNWTYGADWLPNSLEELTQAYVKAIEPGGILLFHDGGRKREKTLALAEAVIKEAREKGFEIVTVGELLGVR